MVRCPGGGPHVLNELLSFSITTTPYEARDLKSIHYMVIEILACKEKDEEEVGYPVRAEEFRT
jgi:hypothetical protein